MYRLPMLIAAASLITGSFASIGLAQNAREVVTPPASLHPPVTLDTDTLRLKFAPSQLGLKPQSSAKQDGISMPFGLNYSRDAKGVVMPLDQKNEWGVGVGLNLNSSEVVELSPNSVLGLQPKRTPGLMLQKKF
jgi:hypothetical protein